VGFVPRGGWRSTLVSLGAVMGNVKMAGKDTWRSGFPRAVSPLLLSCSLLFILREGALGLGFWGLMGVFGWFCWFCWLFDAHGSGCI
jgi:hypothetical protein